MTADDVLAALGTVYDPELDEPITALRFVAACEVAGDGAVSVRLRLPTPQCAPNFAFLMAADAAAAVRALPGAGDVTVVLEDHYTGAEINAAVAGEGGFGDAFPGETEGELDALRELFRRKALVAREGRLLDTVADPASARLTDLDGPDAARCRELRRELRHRRVRRRPGVRARRRHAGPGGRAGAVRPHGLADRDLAGGQRRRVPVPVASPLRHRGGRGMKAARLHDYHQALQLDSVDEPEGDRPVRRRRQDRRGRPVPHRPPHPGGPVGREVPGAAALHPRPRERGLGARGRLGVTNVEVGDTVIVHPFIACGLCTPCRRGDDMHCVNGSFPGIDRDGGFAELLLTSARSVVKLDPSLEPASIAALADAGLTAIHAVKKAIPVLGAGTKAVVIGAGGLGHIGIQCLKAYTPTEIIVVDPNEKALALAEELGADHTVKVEDGKHIEAVQELTDGMGAEAIIDFVGEKGAVEDGVAMIQDGGFYYVIGYGQNIDIPTIDVISREISFIGNLVGTYVDLQDLMTLTAQGKVTLHTTTYPLDAVNDAMADLDGGRLQGRGSSCPPDG